MTDKVLTMREAVARLVPEGASVACGLALEAAIPFAFAHELIRRRRRGLHLVGPIADAIFDQLVGAGCVSPIEAAWVGNVTTGSGYRFRRAVEHGRPGPLTVREHSNLTISLALQAVSSGVGYLPTRTALGSDIAAAHDGFAPVTCPFSGQRLLAVRAVRPDVAVVHVQRADRAGNAQAWGNLGISPDRVDHRTSPGYGDGPGWRERVGLRACESVTLITTRAVLRASEATGAFELVSVHPGERAAEVVEATPWGWPHHAAAAEVPVTGTPDPATLATLRGLDPDRIWTGDG